MIFIEILIFLSSIFPIFHIMNALLAKRSQPIAKQSVKEKRFSVLIPCFNEEDTVEVSIKGMMAMEYTNHEIIYINDGSTDNTLAAFHKALRLEAIGGEGIVHDKIKNVYRSKKYKDVFLIDKVNGGKSDALNVGIAFSRSEIIVTLDADSVLHKDALDRMNVLFEDKSVAAAGGSIHIMQGYDPKFLNRELEGRKRKIIALQMLDYLKGFYIYKLSLAKQNATAIVSGAFGVFRSDILKAVGGYRKTLGEDIDITIRIQKYIRKLKQKVVYMPESLCYTQCPEKWDDLYKQRMRWQKGFVNCMEYHCGFILKTFLFQSMSFHLFVEAFLVGLCSCIFTILTYLFVAAFASSNINILIVFLFYFAFSVAFNIGYDLISIVISFRYNKYSKVALKSLIRMIPLDIFYFRYFNLYVFLTGTISYFWNKNKRDNWNKVRRIKRDFVFESNG